MQNNYVQNNYLYRNFLSGDAIILGFYLEQVLVFTARKSPVAGSN